MENINDESKWTKFVEQLIASTKKGDITWGNPPGGVERENAVGPLFFAEIVPGKYVSIYRYEYRYYVDEDEYELRRDIAIELVDESGAKLWRLPNVRPRHELIDLIEFQAADALGTLEAFLGMNQSENQ